MHALGWLIRQHRFGNRQLATSAPLLLLPLLVGCSLWQDYDRSSLELPIPRMSIDSVAWELSTLHVPSHDDGLQERLWGEVDETILPIETRQRLGANGFRVGVVGVQLPDVLRAKLDEQHTAGDRISSSESETVSRPVYRRLQVRAGDRKEIVTSTIVPELNVFRSHQGVTRGLTLQQAQCVLAASSQPRPDGSVRLEFTPEIQHGQTRQRILADSGAFRFQSGRERFVLDDLRIGIDIVPGQTLVVTSTQPPRGAGKDFFVSSDSKSSTTRIVLLRLSQTQHDGDVRFTDTPSSLATTSGP